MLVFKTLFFQESLWWSRTLWSTIRKRQCRSCEMNAVSSLVTEILCVFVLILRKIRDRMYIIRDSQYTLKNRENGENSNFAFTRTYLRQSIYTSQVQQNIKSMITKVFETCLKLCLISSASYTSCGIFGRVFQGLLPALWK